MECCKYLSILFIYYHITLLLPWECSMVINEYWKNFFNTYLKCLWAGFRASGNSLPGIWLFPNFHRNSQEFCKNRIFFVFFMHFCTDEYQFFLLPWCRAVSNIWALDYANTTFGSNAFRSLEKWLEKRETCDRSSVRVFDSLQKLSPTVI